jgi:hypothetical protein
LSEARLPVQGSYHQAAMPRMRFDSWAEFARFVHQDPSTRGLFVRSAAPAPVDTDIDVQIGLPDGDEITLSGRVVHRVGAEEAQAMGEYSGMGVQFTFISDDQMARIDQLLANAAARQQRGSIPSGTAAGRQSPVPSQPAAPPAKPVAAAPGAHGAAPSRSAESGVLAPLFADASPAPQDPRLHQATSLLERGRFDLAAQHASDVLAEHPGLIAAKILLLVIDARKMRAQFAFEHAIDCYRGVLALDAQHREASELLPVLRKELEHSLALTERMFGR